METSGYFFIKKGICHRVKDPWIYTQCKFSDISCSLIRVQYFIKPGTVVRCGFYDLSVTELKGYIFMNETLVCRRSVICQNTIDRIPDRGSKNLSVRYVDLAETWNNGNVLYGKCQLCAWSLYHDLICFLHDLHKGFKVILHFPVIHKACVKEEILKFFSTHFCQLCHGSTGVPKYHPPGIIDPFPAVDRFEVVFLKNSHSR